MFACAVGRTIDQEKTVGARHDFGVNPGDARFFNYNLTFGTAANPARDKKKRQVNMKKGARYTNPGEVLP